MPHKAKSAAPTSPDCPDKPSTYPATAPSTATRTTATAATTASGKNGHYTTEQPYHYLGLASQYRGILKADSGAHDRKTPLRLLERIGGKKTVAKIAAGEPLRILLADPNQPCAKDAQLGDSDLCADLWLLIQNKDGKTGWVKINYQRDTPDLEGLHPLAE